MSPDPLTKLSQLFDLDPKQLTVLRHHRMKRDDLDINKSLSTCPPSILPSSRSFVKTFIDLVNRPVRVWNCMLNSFDILFWQFYFYLRVNLSDCAAYQLARLCC